MGGTMKTSYLETLQQMVTSRGKRSHELIAPYINDIDEATGPVIKALVNQVPVKVRKRIASLNPFELYCLLRFIDSEFEVKSETRDPD
jgi:hypothetical protein